MGSQDNMSCVSGDDNIMFFFLTLTKRFLYLSPARTEVQNCHKRKIKMGRSNKLTF